MEWADLGDFRQRMGMQGMRLLRNLRYAILSMKKRQRIISKIIALPYGDIQF